MKKAIFQYLYVTDLKKHRCVIASPLGSLESRNDLIKFCRKHGKKNDIHAYALYLTPEYITITTLYAVYNHKDDSLTYYNRENNNEL